MLSLLVKLIKGTQSCVFGTGYYLYIFPVKNKKKCYFNFFFSKSVNKKNEECVSVAHPRVHAACVNLSTHVRAHTHSLSLQDWLPVSTPFDYYDKSKTHSGRIMKDY